MNHLYQDPSQRGTSINMQAAQQQAVGINSFNKIDREPSEIAGELQLLDEALSRLARMVDEMGERLASVSLQACGVLSGERAPAPVLCPTATTIYYSRAVVNDLADKLRGQIDALRC